MANVNSPYSQDTVTPSQRGEQVLSAPDGSYVDGFSEVPSEENAHDLQNAPTNLYEAPLDNDSTNRPSAAEVADRAAGYNAPRRRLPAHDFVPIDTTESLGSDGA